MIKTLLAGALIVTAAQASALSCMRPDVARAFNWASDAEESYAVIMGSFRYDAVPVTNRIPQEYQMRAQFSGQALGVDGFNDVAPFELIIDVQCSASWCGFPPPMDTTTLAFVESTPRGYVLRADACGSMVFAPVAVLDVGRVEACMRGETCDEDLTR